MGSNSDDPAEKPPHRVSIGQPFAIGKYEVTVEQWNACADAGACTRIAIDGNRGQQCPDARRQLGRCAGVREMARARWAASRTGCPPRPNGNTRRAAARPRSTGGATQMRKGNANCKDCGDPWSAEGPANVGSFAANPLRPVRHERQRLGMGRRLLAQLLQERPRRRPRLGRPRVLRARDPRRLVARRRGYMQSATRFKYSASVRQSQNGFRVARDMK